MTLSLEKGGKNLAASPPMDIVGRARRDKGSSQKTLNHHNAHLSDPCTFADALAALKDPRGEASPMDLWVRKMEQAATYFPSIHTVIQVTLTYCKTIFYMLITGLLCH